MLSARSGSERDSDPPATRPAHDAPVAVRIDFAEVELRQRVKQAGGRWNPDRRVWELPYAQVAALKLEARITEAPASYTGRRRYTKPKGIYMEMRWRHPHQDACILHRMPASETRFSAMQSNYS